ncbi:LysR family transcriptional regulator [Aliiruegeria haliotis]|uniref:LysR family transcriptional regulator n=1 Tax=Aliiruegeria haliotis TaxID=1280846 RepID=A0A2T0RN29_9RHOB|nr:LysR family transcriptional regulator ArgP [Aliiruegeria haliotis]PRY22594.1 LysR family transcriptional regulator [Aliiruegeria haliotis]
MLSIDTAQLAALAEVIRTGSFDRAAGALHVTPSAISQRIKSLEERLGTVLVRRGQPCIGTEAGLRLYRHAEEVALLEQALSVDIGPIAGTAGHHAVRIASNADSLATWLPPALAAAAGDAPGLLFDLTLDDQDHSADWLRRGEVVAAVTAHAAPVQGCDSTALGALRYIATASPAYMRTHFPDGVTPEALAEAPVMTFDRKDQLQARWLQMKGGRKLSPPSHFLPSTQAFVDAALAGLGWGMNPEPLVQGHIAAGRLVPLDPTLPLDTPLHWQVSRIAAPALAPLTGAIRQAARTVLWPT